MIGAPAMNVDAIKEAVAAAKEATAREAAAKAAAAVPAPAAIADAAEAERDTDPDAPPAEPAAAWEQPTGSAEPSTGLIVALIVGVVVILGAAAFAAMKFLAN